MLARRWRVNGPRRSEVRVNNDFACCTKPVEAGFRSHECRWFGRKGKVLSAATDTDVDKTVIERFHSTLKLVLTGYCIFVVNASDADKHGLSDQLFQIGDGLRRFHKRKGWTSRPSGGAGLGKRLMEQVEISKANRQLGARRKEHAMLEKRIRE